MRELEGDEHGFERTVGGGVVVEECMGDSWFYVRRCCGRARHLVH